MTVQARRLLARGRRGARRALHGARTVVARRGSDIRVQHFGTTRFSLFQPGSAAWRLTRRSESEDAEAYAAQLFSDERLGPRFEIFCDVAAPLYQQMAAGRRYRHLVLYSSVMPQHWKERLREAAERYPVLWLHESQDGKPDVRALLRGHLQEYSRHRDSLVFAFRVDDDDLLSADFLDQVEPYVVPQHHDHVISFSNGYAGLYEDGRYSHVVTWQQRLSSMGQGAIGRWRAAENKLALTLVGNHNNSDRSRTVLLDGRRPTYLQTRHLGQDTAMKENEPVDLDLVRSRMLKELGRRPRVSDPAELLKRFPSLASRLDLTP